MHGVLVSEGDPWSTTNSVFTACNSLFRLGGHVIIDGMVCKGCHARGGSPMDVLRTCSLQMLFQFWTEGIYVLEFGR